MKLASGGCVCLTVNSFHVDLQRQHVSCSCSAVCSVNTDGAASPLPAHADTNWTFIQHQSNLLLLFLPFFILLFCAIRREDLR